MTVFVPLALVAALLAPADGGKIKWTPGTPEEALDRAKPGKRPVMAYFRADNSAYCTTVEAVAFSDNDVVKASEPFERVIVDLSDREVLKKMFQRYAVKAVPTVIFWNGKGELVQTIQGVQPPEVYLRAMGLIGKPPVEDAARAGGASAPQEWRDTHRVHLRNGNFVDGRLDQPPGDTELVLVFGKGTTLKIRLLDVTKIEVITMRHVNEKAREVEIPRPSLPDDAPPGPDKPVETVEYDETGKPVLNRFVERGLRETVEKLGEDLPADEEAGLLKDLEQGGAAGKAYVAWLLRDARWELRRAAAKSLGLLKHAPAAKALAALLDAKEEWPVIEQACVALGRLGAKDAVKPLIEMLRSSYKEVVKAAASSLKSITGAEDLGESHAAWTRWWLERKD